MRQQDSTILRINRSALHKDVFIEFSGDYGCSMVQWAALLLVGGSQQKAEVISQ
jgi:hypothetical protein